MRIMHDHTAPQRTAESAQAKAPGRADELESLIAGDAFRLKINELRLTQRYEKRPQDTKVSVIMPTWNRAFVIGRAIDSALGQLYGNLELIVSDDGSTDSTEDLVKSNYEQDGRVRYIKSRHTGVSHARNVGLEHSTGSLIAYLDSDNVWADNYLLLMVNTFVDNPNVNTMYCGVRVIDNVGKRDYIRLKEYDRKRLLMKNYIDMNVFMHRSLLFEEFGGFNEELTALVDWELILRYTEKHVPYVLDCSLATYYIERDFGHITRAEDVRENYRKIRNLNGLA